MHELGLCEAIVAATVRRAAGRRVTAVRVRIGGVDVDVDGTDDVRLESITVNAD